MKPLEGGHGSTALHQSGPIDSFNSMGFCFLVSDIKSVASAAGSSLSFSYHIGKQTDQFVKTIMNSSYTACYTMDPNSYAEGTIPLNIDAGLPMAYNGYYTSTGSMAGSQHAQVSSQALKSSRRAPLRYPCEAGPSAPLPTSTSTMAVSMPAKIPPYPIIKTEHSFGVGRVVASGEQSYARLLFDCLMEAPNHRLPLADIYEWVLARSTKAQSSKGKGWQNSIRHNLSMNKVSYAHHKTYW